MNAATPWVSGKLFDTGTPTREANIKLLRYAGDAYRKPKDVSTQAEILRTLAGYGVEATNKLVQQQQVGVMVAATTRDFHSHSPNHFQHEDR